MNSQSLEIVNDQIMKLLAIINELENSFPGRRFTLDGHLFGSIGEVLAKYYYGIELAPTGTKTHDGMIDGKNVQIKITQACSVDITDFCDYLLVLYLNKKECKVYEVYNGPGDVALKNRKKLKSGWYNRSILQLSELGKTISEEERIKPVVEIEKWDKSKRNKVSAKC